MTEKEMVRILSIETDESGKVETKEFGAVELDRGQVCYCFLCGYAFFDFYFYRGREIDFPIPCCPESKDGKHMFTFAPYSKMENNEAWFVTIWGTDKKYKL